MLPVGTHPFVGRRKTIELVEQEPKAEDVQLRWFARWFANSMRPAENKIKWKMKTMNVFVPDSNIGTDILDQFLTTIDDLEQLLKAGENHSFNKQKIVTALGSLLKFKFGEGIWFIMAHNMRHLQQARNVLQLLKSK